MRYVKEIILIFILTLFLEASGDTDDSVNKDSNGTKEETNELVVVSWGGAGTEAQREVWYDSFTAETGIEIKEVSPPSTSQLKAQIDSGNVDWDIVLLDAPH